MSAELNTFKSASASRQLSIWFAAFCVLCLLGLSVVASIESRAGYALLALVYGLGAVRARRSGVVIQTEDKVVVRGLDWTRKVARARVSRFTVESGSIRPLRRSASFLVAELSDGSTRALKDFNEPLGIDGEQRLEAVAAALNAAWNLR